MGWLVVDTNQVSRGYALFSSNRCDDFEGISLSPLVLCELLHSNNRQPLNDLLRWPVRLGMTPGEVMTSIATCRRSRIVDFIPFHQRTPQQVRALLDPANKNLKEFEQKASNHIHAWEKNMKIAIPQLRRAINALISQGLLDRWPKFADVTQILDHLSNGVNSPVGRFIEQGVYRGGNHTVRANPKALFTGTKANPYLWRYYRTILWYVLSYSSVWGKQADRANRPPKDNDWTDLTLSLYAAPGDVILTEDKMTRLAVSAVNPDREIKTALATDI